MPGSVGECVYRRHARACVCVLACACSLMDWHAWPVSCGGGDDPSSSCLSLSIDVGREVIFISCRVRASCVPCATAFCACSDCCCSRVRECVCVRARACERAVFSETLGNDTRIVYCVRTCVSDLLSCYSVAVALSV